MRPLLNATKTYGGKIDQAVRVDGVNSICQMMPDDQTKSIIYCYTTKFAENAAIYALHEGYKFIPGLLITSNFEMDGSSMHIRTVFVSEIVLEVIN